MESINELLRKLRKVRPTSLGPNNTSILGIDMYRRVLAHFFS